MSDDEFNFWSLVELPHWDRAFEIALRDRWIEPYPTYAVGLFWPSHRLPRLAEGTDRTQCACGTAFVSWTGHLLGGFAEIMTLAEMAKRSGMNEETSYWLGNDIPDDEADFIARRDSWRRIVTPFMNRRFTGLRNLCEIGAFVIDAAIANWIAPDLQRAFETSGSGALILGERRALHNAMFLAYEGLNILPSQISVPERADRLRPWMMVSPPRDVLTWDCVRALEDDYPGLFQPYAEALASYETSFRATVAMLRTCAERVVGVELAKLGRQSKGTLNDQILRLDDVAKNLVNQGDRSLRRDALRLMSVAEALDRLRDVGNLVHDARDVTRDEVNGVFAAFAELVRVLAGGNGLTR